MFLDPYSWEWLILAAVWGALWGSFGNVFIYRWPLEKSVVRPASRCDSCGTPVRWFDNVPVFSYILLLGRCRKCNQPIGIQTPLVELTMALFSLLLYRHALLNIDAAPLHLAAWFFIYFIFVWGLLVVSVIDLQTMLLPDVITLGGCALGLLASLAGFGPDILESLIAAASSFLVIYVLFILGYRLVTGSPGMGMGDAKLLAMIGAFLGIRGSIFSLFAGALQGLVIGGGLMIFSRSDKNTEAGPGKPGGFRKQKIPFGPFLAIGALEYFFWGERIIEKYIELFTRLLNALKIISYY